MSWVRLWGMLLSGGGRHGDVEQGHRYGTRTTSSRRMLVVLSCRSDIYHHCVCVFDSFVARAHLKPSSGDDNTQEVW
jgi:hypothetical protein